jgi:hypothetical protein
VNTLTPYANPHYAHGTPDGDKGTVTLGGRRFLAVRQAWHMGRVWVQISGQPHEWFNVSAASAATFEASR